MYTYAQTKLLKRLVNIMYTLGEATPVVAGVTTAIILPNTGVASSVVSLAIAVVVGMVVWGVLYARANR